MRYSISIDNVTSKKWGLNVNQAYLFAWIYTLPSWAEPIQVGGQMYFHASKNKAIEEIPLITDKVDTMYRYYKSLEKLQLIELIKVEGKDFLRLLDKAKDWNKRQSDQSENNPSNGNNSDHSDKNPAELGKLSENHSENYPTNKYISNNKIISNKKEPDGFSFENIFSNSFEIFSKAGPTGVFFEKIKQIHGLNSEQLKYSYEWWKKYNSSNSEFFKTEQHLRNSFNKFVNANLSKIVEASHGDSMEEIIALAEAEERRRNDG